ncbi:hypothetical protein B0H17DRAFT_1205718 [Mycena rosella]|uniref:Uncharacterized protein n=1 Tax=Mycena rosella TaxID=1033263 RepID=A0AAD7D769_MYCRO|nr:hypothetical protein B0H17DRAFT_1205718 [Mycena rosella]
MVPPKPTELFRGNSTAEKAHTWLRTLELSWKYDADIAEKLYRFERGLHPGSAAEEWWSGLTAADKKDWKSLMVAFEVKWPKPKATRRAQDTVIKELSTNCLDRDALGKYVDDEDGVSVLSHIAWAQVTRALLGELSGGDAAMLLKSAIRATLPIEFRHLVVETGADSWEKYLKAVEDVPVDRINDAVEERTQRHAGIDNDVRSFFRSNPNPTAEQEEEFDEHFTSQLFSSLGLGHLLKKSASPQHALGPSASPRKAYTPSAARQSAPAPQFTPAPAPRPYQAQTPLATMTPHMPWASRTASDVFGSSMIHPPTNTFAKSLLATPISPSAGRERPATLSGDVAGDVDLASHISQHPRLYSNDAAGRPPDYTTFPLSPGTVAPGSRECFRCGVLTIPAHFGSRACEGQNSRAVPIREQNLRSLVGGIIHPRGQRTPARVSQIQEVPYDLFGGYDPDQPLYEEGVESENGEEPAV